MAIKHSPQPPIDNSADTTDCVLKVNNLQFAYPDGHAALHGINFTLARGEKVALVGPNGAGKSTLMLHLNGIYGGENTGVTVDGLEMTKANLPTIRAKVGLVFQDPNDQLFSPTVFEDVAFGPLHMGFSEAEVRDRVSRSLAQVGMEGFEDRLSHNMSTGQKKRVAIATVLAMEPAMLVLDEPSAGLDPRGRRALINLLRDLPLTMLVSTHDMLLVNELFPRMLVIDEGSVVADAPTKTLMQDAALLEQHGLESPFIAL